MTGPDVVEVDPRGPLLADWHRLRSQGRRARFPDDVVPPLAEVRADAVAGLPEHDPSEQVRLALARDADGTPVGALYVDVPLRDNTHLVYAEADVDPAARRRGVGGALLVRAEHWAREHGRRLLTTDLEEPAAQVDSSVGRAFLAARGFQEGLREVRRDLALPVPADHLDALEAQARGRARGYRVLVWRDRCPDELLDARAELGRVMSVDAPLGALDWQEEAWDAARVRERERLHAAAGRAVLVAAVQERAGEQGQGQGRGGGALVGFSEVAFRPADPRQVEQWETLVLGPHRGHRLGLLLKTAVLRRLAQDVPAARSVSTHNAETNGPMVAVNEALGFRPTGLSSSWQRAVSP